MKPAIALLCVLAAAAQVTSDHLKKADPGNWLSYHGSYDSRRHSLL